MQDERSLFLDQSLWSREEKRLKKELEKLKKDAENLKLYEKAVEKVNSEEGSAAVQACLELINATENYQHWKEFKLEDAVFTKTTEGLKKSKFMDEFFCKR